MVLDSQTVNSIIVAVATAAADTRISGSTRGTVHFFISPQKKIIKKWNNKKRKHESSIIINIILMTMQLILIFDSIIINRLVRN